MAHEDQMNFVRGVKRGFPEFFKNRSVLEIGSLDINGSVRQFFEDCEYIGCDLGEGKGVDVIAYGHELDYPDKHFDVSISCECFEHDKHWEKTFKNMTRMTSGLVIFTCATEGRPEHGTSSRNPSDAPFTNDYYRNLTDKDFKNMMDFEYYFRIWNFHTNHNSHDLYFWGLR